MTLRWNIDFNAADTVFCHHHTCTAHNSITLYENIFYCKPVKYDVDSNLLNYKNKTPLFYSTYWLNDDITRHALLIGGRISR
jgi:hypothetical protein